MSEQDQTDDKEEQMTAVIIKHEPLEEERLLKLICDHLDAHLHWRGL